MFEAAVNVGRITAFVFLASARGCNISEAFVNNSVAVFVLVPQAGLVLCVCVFAIIFGACCLK